VTYLFDTNILVFMLRGLKVRKNPTAQQSQRHQIALRILEHARKRKDSGHSVALSAITVAELEYGAWNSGNYEIEVDVVRRAITPFEQFPFDAGQCAVHYGAIRYKLESTGKPIGSLDTLIAAHARAVGAILVTNNTSEFARVPKLKCEDWTARQAGGEG
jgi:tRNA(fMet)-specific endonuclease VapC